MENMKEWQHNLITLAKIKSPHALVMIPHTMGKTQQAVLSQELIRLKQIVPSK